MPSPEALGTVSLSLWPGRRSTVSLASSGSLSARRRESRSSRLPASNPGSGRSPLCSFSEELCQQHAVAIHHPRASIDHPIWEDPGSRVAVTELSITDVAFLSSVALSRSSYVRGLRMEISARTTLAAAVAAAAAATRSTRVRDGRQASAGLTDMRVKHFYYHHRLIDHTA